MAFILKNKNLEIHIDSPEENYNLSRFDWTGKIVKVLFRNILVSSSENKDSQDNHDLGKGFYNEFGIDTALGYDETEIGDWFHKIGVGLLKKDDKPYFFRNQYEIKPANFEIISESNRLQIICKSEAVNGYSYLLRKEIVLEDSGFVIKYYLENRGQKDINTNEYVHNYIAINKEAIGKNYVLKFPFDIKPELFGETVNPENKVNIGRNEINFNGSPEEQFFFSNLSGTENVKATWELINSKNTIGIVETTSFQTNRVNLWGWGHVISPELFITLDVKPGQSTEWSRNYKIFQVT